MSSRAYENAWLRFSTLNLYFTSGRKLWAASLACFYVLNTNFNICIDNGALEAPKQVSAPFGTHMFKICGIFTLLIYFYLVKSSILPVSIMWAYKQREHISTKKSHEAFRNIIWLFNGYTTEEMYVTIKIVSSKTRKYDGKGCDKIFVITRWSLWIEPFYIRYMTRLTTQHFPIGRFRN